MCLLLVALIVFRVHVTRWQYKFAISQLSLISKVPREVVEAFTFQVMVLAPDANFILLIAVIHKALPSTAEKRERIKCRYNAN